MKKILLIVAVASGCLFSPVFAGNNFEPFTTVEQAQEFCPPINTLVFTANNPATPKSPGMVTGNNRIAFENIPPKTAIHPNKLNSGGLITDAQFRSADGLYGYISNNVITCLYAYQTIFNTEYNLVMRGG